MSIKHLLLAGFLLSSQQEQGLPNKGAPDKSLQAKVERFLQGRAIRPEFFKGHYISEESDATFSVEYMYLTENHFVSFIQ